MSSVSWSSKLIEPKEEEVIEPQSIPSQVAQLDKGSSLPVQEISETQFDSGVGKIP